MAKLSLTFLVIFAIAFVCHAGVPQKRETKDGDIVSDASQALDKLFEDFNQGIHKLANEGINVEGIVQNATSKLNEIGQQIQDIGKDIGAKVQEAAKKQGLTD